MPRQQSLPTWTAWNNANFATESGLTDTRTGQPYQAGGLGLGDFFEATEREANNASNLANGLLHNGQYRLVHVDSAATVANVKTGTIGYLRIGSFVQGAVISAVGTATTAGTYTVPVPPGSGGGSGAVIQVVIATTGILSVTVLAGGANYSSVPTVNLATLPGAPTGTVALQLNSSPNEVTSFDQAATMKTQLRPVVFLNAITPGNYGFVQELGLATLLSGGAIANVGNWVIAMAGGLATDGGSGGAPSNNLGVGQSVDACTAAGQMFKVYLNEGGVYQD